jgi:hypothetical protein
MRDGTGAFCLALTPNLLAKHTFVFPIWERESDVKNLWRN